MWDVWVVFKEEGCSYFFGQIVDGFGCDVLVFVVDDLFDEVIEMVISYVVYCLFSYCFSVSVNGMIL